MWRKKVDKSLKPYLEKFIAETHLHKTSFNSAADPAKAQLWIAISLLSKQLFSLEMKLNYLEKALKDISQAKESEKFIQEIEKQVKKPKQEPKTEKIEKETEALGEGALLLSQIAKRSVKKNTKTKLKGKTKKKR